MRIIFISCKFSNFIGLISCDISDISIFFSLQIFPCTKMFFYYYIIYTNSLIYFDDYFSFIRIFKILFLKLFYNKLY